MSRRQQAEEAAAKIATPILAGLGLELLDVTLTGPGKAPILRFTLDRPGGGVTVDELQAASGAIETALEVAEVLPGRYNLEVSSPGIDRPWKRLEDFARHVGERASLKTFAPLADGRRQLTGRLLAVEGGLVRFEPDGGAPVEIEFSNIAAARPEVDWAALLRGRRPSPAAESGGSAHEP
ncbi:MAG TPA: ribosome maturation factor RimP [bacterium]